MTAYDQDIRSGAAKSAALRFYEEVFPDKHCGDFNQALMDLGSCICLPNGVPHCEKCPWRDACRAKADGTCQQLPLALPKAKRTIEYKTVLLIYYQGRLALRRRPEKGLLAGLYEYPTVDGILDASEVSSYLRTLGFSSVRCHSLPEAVHVFTHKEWHMTGREILADEWEDFAPGKPKAHELFLADLSGLQDTYSIPSAFSKYTAQIRTDYMK